MIQKWRSMLRNPHPLVPVAFISGFEALLMAWLFHSPETLLGRPITEDVVFALLISASVGPGLAWILAIWKFERPSAAAANRPMIERLLARPAIVAFCLAPLLWAFFALVAWYEGKPPLPEYAIGLFAGVQALASIVFLADAVVSARRRRNALGGITP